MIKWRHNYEKCWASKCIKHQEVTTFLVTKSFRWFSMLHDNFKNKLRYSRIDNSFTYTSLIKSLLFFFRSVPRKFKSVLNSTNSYQFDLMPRIRGTSLVSSPHRIFGCASIIERIKVVPWKSFITKKYC